MKNIDWCIDSLKRVNDINQKINLPKDKELRALMNITMPNNLSDVTRLFREAGSCNDFDHIFIAMGNLGLPSRILSYKLGSFVTYTSPLETKGNTQEIGHLDPITLCDMYNFHNLDILFFLPFPCFLLL